MVQREGEGFHYKSYLESPLMDEMVYWSFLHYSTRCQKKQGGIGAKLITVLH